jgi:hypothetical protein
MADEETFTTFDISEGGQHSSHLREQSLENLDPTKLHPLSPEVISRQATVNIGNNAPLKSQKRRRMLLSAA